MGVRGRRLLLEVIVKPRSVSEERGQLLSSDQSH